MNDLASLNNALSDRYIIERELGRGGMATVYLARDLRHSRLVALKLLNPELGAMLGEERFLSEIRVTANLQHPNLLPLFDSGAADGLLYYVMPYVDGESLRARLERDKQLPIDDALRFAIAIANALDYAHTHGVVHRDLKPENILVQHGEAVVADFGIALAVSNAGGSRITQTGISLGTPQYMSPEQATGNRNIDGRSDIYSLGAMVYEMIGGEAPHTGTSGQAVIAKLMTEEPRRLSALRRSVPAHVESAVHKALEKLPADRWSSARDFVEALRGTRPVERMQRVGQREGSSWLLGTLAGVAALAIIVATIEAVALRRAPTALPADTIRFPFVTADSQSFSPLTPAIPFAVSPDDRKVAYVGNTPKDEARLFIRGLDDMQTRSIAGLERPLSPAFSPDGKWISVNASGRIAKVSVDGGTVSTIVNLNGKGNAGVQWLNADTLIASIGGTLQAVPVNGGVPVVLSRPDSAHGELLQWGPRIVNSRFIAYTSVGTTGISSNKVSILDRRTGKTSATPYSGTTVIGTVDNKVVWVMTSGNVMMAALDANGSLGSARLVLEDVFVRSGGAAKAAMGTGGTLIYQRGLAVSELMLVDERGQSTPLGVEPHAYKHPRWSPDGSQIAVAISRVGGSDIWLINVRTKTLAKLTNGNGQDDQPAWTPDGQHVIYRSIEETGTSLKSVAVDGSGATVQIVGSKYDPYSGNFSHDGKTLLFRTGDLTSALRYIFSMPIGGNVPPTLLVGGHASNLAPTLSPDDKWLAYTSDASGVLEVYLRPFPGPGPAMMVSRGGGNEPTWSHDGKTLFFRSAGAMNAVSVTTSPLATSEPRVIFKGLFLNDAGYTSYDMAPGDKQFLMLRGVDRQAETVVIYHWADELRKNWR